jgi:hypothetical protein
MMRPPNDWEIAALVSIGNLLSIYFQQRGVKAILKRFDDLDKRLEDKIDHFERPVVRP